jgi:hypothetical protein
MRTSKHILMLSIAVLMLAAVTATAEETGKAIQDLVMQTYGFDSAAYRVEVVSSQLKTSATAGAVPRARDDHRQRQRHRKGTSAAQCSSLC